jgi:hypothetical protein
MAIKVDEKFASLVETIAKEIVTVEHFGSGSIIKTPIIYPSGASTVVQITQHGDRFFVTDMGLGHQEAEMIGASTLYVNSAKSLAQHYGILFDNHAFFVAEASREQLAGAVTVVANCSSEAAALAAYRAAERKFEEDTDVLYRKLTLVFSKSEVERDVEFAGSSTHRWRIATIVHHGSRIALFEPVSKHPVSVVTTAAKFHDIARLDNPPGRISVVKKKDEFGNLINVLAQAGDVIDFEAPKETLLKLAEAT